ncbi:MAG: hypothetical protein GY757_17440 [bacterium]|nr:hypothetical protein [bacterium]
MNSRNKKTEVYLRNAWYDNRKKNSGFPKKRMRQPSIGILLMIMYGIFFLPAWVTAASSPTASSGLDTPLPGECFAEPGTNLALSKEIMQSSYDFGKTGFEAVDGDSSGLWANGGVTCTHYENQAWWMVDLGDYYQINEVEIYNRTDCCSERLSNFDVKLSEDAETWQSFYVPGQCQSPTSVSCSGNVARYVKIQLRGSNFLSLAEVVILGDGPFYNNVAIGKPAVQSSNQFGKTGAEAVDGNTSGDFGTGSVTCTEITNQPAWMLDLEEPYEIYDINVYNRTDCCGERLSDFDIKISEDGSVWESIHVPGECQSPTTVNFGGLTARYVTVQLRGFNYLSLAEVEVMGKGPIRENIALGKTASQSSNNFSTTGTEALDGNIDGDSSSGSMSHTHPDSPSWWQVDLGSSYALEEIRVYNRTDCCAERLRNFEIKISQDEENWETILVPDQALRPSYINVSGHIGRFIRIQLTAVDFLSLPEVEVMIKK